MRRILIGWLLFGCLFAAQAQTYFNERYALNPAQQQSAAVSILPTQDGYWVNGQTINPQNPNAWQLFLQFIDSAGAVRGPLKRWGSVNYSYYSGISGNALFRTADGGMTVAGGAEDGTVQWGLLWRFNAQGDTLWTRRYDVGYSMGFYNGCVTRDGGFALVGTQRTGFNLPLDVVLVRTDSSGNELWRRTYRQAPRNRGYFVMETADGGFLITGLCGPPPTTPYTGDALIIKVAADGQPQWTRTYGGPYYEAASAALPTDDGGYLVATTRSYRLYAGEVLARAVLLWYDSAGTLVRERRYGPPRHVTELYSLHQLPDGGYILGGQTTDSIDLSGVYPVAYLLRVCADGDSVWQRTHKILPGPQSHNYLRDLRPTADGGFVAAGFLFPRPPDTGTADSWVFKTDQYGYLQAGGAPPLVTCGPVAATSELIIDNEQLVVWPNPSADGRFYFSRDSPGTTTLTVTDALGREVWCGMWDGAAETVVDLRRQLPGLYLLRVVGPDGWTQTRKLVWGGN